MSQKHSSAVMAVIDLAFKVDLVSTFSIQFIY